MLHKPVTGKIKYECVLILPFLIKQTSDKCNIYPMLLKTIVWLALTTQNYWPTTQNGKVTR